MKKTKKRWIVFFSSVLLLFSCANTEYDRPLPVSYASHDKFCPMLVQNPPETEKTAGTDSEFPGFILPQPPEPVTMTFNFVGDVMLAAENGYDGFWSFNLFAYETEPSYYFKRMQYLFANDDYTVANCENVFTDKKELTEYPKEEDPAYWYRSGTENAEIYRAGNIEIVSLANNHVLDYGREGREDTRKALTDVGRTVVGECESVVLEKNGLRVGLLCASMYSDFWAEKVFAWLEDAVRMTDFQIIYFHGGTERVHEPEEWKIRVCHGLVDAGADLIVGSHPHVLQRIETYNGVDIVYSLGNFLFGGSHTCENRTAVYHLELDITDGHLTSKRSQWIPCCCYGELWQPMPIPKTDKAYEPVMAFLRGEAELPYIQ